MSDAEFLEAMRAGLLVGIPVGAVMYAAVREAWLDFKHWRHELLIRADLSKLRPRCELHDECIAGRGHNGDCDLQPYT